MANCNYCNDAGCWKCNPVGNTANSALKNFKLVNPIPAEVSDPSKLKSFFKNNNYIPYAGYVHDSQHTVLSFIDNLAALSPTLGGVINSIGFACFGGKTNIKKVNDPDFDLTDQNDVLNKEIDLPIETKKAYLAWLNTFDLGKLDWSSLKNNLFQSLKTNGNIFVVVEIFNSLGQYRIKITPQPTKNCLYVNPTLFEGNNIAVSKSWEQKYLKDNPPVTIPVYPNYQKDKDGSIKTIFHIKAGNNDFYGRPDWLPCAYDAFLEIKNKEYLLTAAHNQFTGKLIMEYEEDHPAGELNNDTAAREAGFKNSSDRFDHNFTNNGDNPMSVFAMRRAKGSSPMAIHEVNLNMNEKYYAEADKMATDKIILVNGWSRKLLGYDENGGSLGGNTYVDTLKTKLPLIESIQDAIDNQTINKICDFIKMITGKNEFLEIGLESKNPFDHILKAMDVNNNNTGSKV